MNELPPNALVVTKAADEVQDPLTAPPDSDYNFVEDRAARQWLDQNVASLFDYVRGEYSAQHGQWGDIRRMANLERDGNAAYDGRSNAYLPVYQRALETRVSHTSRGLFPSDSYMSCDSVIPNMPPEQVIAAKAWMEYQLETSAKVRSEIKPFIRTLFNYGIAVGKGWWNKPPVSEKKTSMKKLEGIPQMLMDYSAAKPWTYEGARFQARNIFSFYVWPISVNSLEEASIVFEDIQVSKQFVDDMVARGLWAKGTEDLGSSGASITNTAMEEQLGEVGATTTTAQDYSGGDLANWRLVTEAWFRMPVPKALYRENEIVGSAVPVKVIFIGGTPVEARRNPFWHQRPPYLLMRINENPDSLFTVGMGKAAGSLQYLANDFINQTNDNGIYGLNPITKVNPNVIVGPLEPLEPGRVWSMTDMNGVQFDRPPIEQMQYGMMITNQIISYLNDMSGAPAVLQGSGAKGGASTATGAQILQNNVKGDLQDIIEDIELRVLEPLMEMFHSLGQQYESAERWLAISGGQKIQFTRDMLEGEFMWRWVASSQTVNKQQRAQASIQFAQMAASMAPLLQMQGKQFNPEPVLRRIWEDGLGQRNFDEVITQMQPQPMPGMPGMGGPPGPGGPQAPPQDPRSAVEQAPGGSGEMAEGEAEAFGEVRAGADQMAAEAGTNGGME